MNRFENGCAHCNTEPEWLGQGWIEQPNNGPIVNCPVCNEDKSKPRNED